MAVDTRAGPFGFPGAGRPKGFHNGSMSSEQKASNMLLSRIGAKTRGETKERKANKRNRDKQRQKRRANRIDECRNAASRIVRPDSGQVVERKQGMKFY
jgi:hypothetical protein